MESKQDNVLANGNLLEIQDEIGTGLQSSVRLCKDPKSDQLFALKEFKDDQLPYLAKEVEALQLFTHPNIVKMYGSNSNSIALEYAGYGDFVNLIQNTGGLPERVAKFFFKGLILGLKHIHDKNWAHRDIKADNLLLTDDLQIKIADFGFSIENNDGELVYDIVGSREYQSLQLQNLLAYDPKKADIFAAGVTLFGMVHNSYPFNFSNQSNKYAQYNQFVLNPKRFWKNKFDSNHIDTSFEFKNLIQSMLASKPESRSNVDEILAHPWLQDNVTIEEVKYYLSFFNFYNSN